MFQLASLKTKIYFCPWFPGKLSILFFFLLVKINTMQREDHIHDFLSAFPSKAQV